MKKKEGWICPKCGCVWASWIPECSHCNKKHKEK
jgi:hypothetical protein